MQTSLTLSLPYFNCVYQRNKEGFATIPVAGTVAAGTTQVLATFTRLKVGAVQTLEYVSPIVQTLPVDVNGNFAGSVSVPGGWYSLSVATETETITLAHVGAGEVFVKFGHSFLAGGHDKSYQPAATDERVISLQDGMDKREYKYGQLNQQIGPFNIYADAWGMFGDQLVKKLGVPVLIYGAAYGGSNLQMNLEVIAGSPLTVNPPGYPGAGSRMPFAPLENTMDNYVSQTGIRAILFEHGYNDRGTDRATYLSRLKQFFDYVRSHWQKPDLAIVMVQEQFQASGIVSYDTPTALAQADFIATYPNVYKGPDFNGSEWNSIFATHDHLFGTGIDLFAKEWVDSINDAFLKQSTPYGPVDIPQVFPAVLYNAPTTDVKTFDWVILGLAAACLVGVYVWHKKYLMWGFLLLGLIALGRKTGKI